MVEALRQERRVRKRSGQALRADVATAALPREALAPRVGALEHRLREAVKQIVFLDADVRDLNAAVMRAWLLPIDHSLAAALLLQRKAWVELREIGKPHPLGPPQRWLGLCVVQHAMQWKENEGVAAWRAMHEAMREPAELEVSVQLCCVRGAGNDKGALLRFKPRAAAAALWQPVLRLLSAEVEAAGGAELRDPAAPSARVREMQAWAYKRER